MSSVAALSSEAGLSRRSRSRSWRLSARLPPVWGWCVPGGLRQWSDRERAAKAGRLRSDLDDVKDVSERVLRIKASFGT